jgi:copper(I)-binding protein
MFRPVSMQHSSLALPAIRVLPPRAAADQTRSDQPAVSRGPRRLPQCIGADADHAGMTIVQASPLPAASPVAGAGGRLRAIVYARTSGHLSGARLVAALLAATIGGFVLVPSTNAASPSGSVLATNDGVKVQEAWARASAGAASTGAAYVTLVGGAQPDQLVGSTTPVAATAEVHETINDNGVMKMRPVASIPLPPGQTVTFTPGGYHIMLTGLQKPLTVGRSFPLTLTFAHAGPVTVDVQVRALGYNAPGATMTDPRHMR